LLFGLQEQPAICLLHDRLNTYVVLYGPPVKGVIDIGCFIADLAALSYMPNVTLIVVITETLAFNASSANNFLGRVHSYLPY